MRLKLRSARRVWYYFASRSLFSFHYFIFSIYLFTIHYLLFFIPIPYPLFHISYSLFTIGV